MKNRALIDLVILAIVFWGVWGLRQFGVENIGLLTMVAGVGTGAILLAARREPPGTIGLKSGGGARWTLARAGEVALLVLIVGAVGIGLATALGYPPSAPTAVSEQPQTLPAFLLDILLGVWIGAAIGEEIFFRGLLLSRFRALFGGGKIAIAAAIAAQAVWFGLGHASQGLSGMIVTGAAGLALAIYFVTRARGSLMPMIIGHGLVDTISLSIAYVT